MKVIFLDIDGVLATRSSISAWHARMTKLVQTGNNDEIEAEIAQRKSPGGNAGELDSACVGLFLRLLDITKANVVISSSWRYDKRNDKIWQDLFGDKYIGKTRRDLDSGRGDEIQELLDKHPEVDKFVILDDESCDMGNRIKFMVETEMIGGFTDWQFSQCLQRLI